MDREHSIYSEAGHSRPQRSTQIPHLSPALSWGAGEELIGVQAWAQGRRWPLIPTEGSPRHFTLFVPLFFFSLPASFSLFPGFELVQNYVICTTCNVERGPNYPSTSPPHLPFLFLFLPPSLHLFLYLPFEWSHSWWRRKDCFPASRGSEFWGGGWTRWLTKSILQLRKLNAGDEVFIFFFLLVCCVCVCMVEREKRWNAKMVYSILPYEYEYTIISLFSSWWVGSSFCFLWRVLPGSPLHVLLHIFTSHLLLWTNYPWISGLNQ